jgi:hypothetical protein
MIPLDVFMEHIRKCEIPPCAPDCTSLRGDKLFDTRDFTSFTARAECQSYGMYAVVDQHWTQKLSAWIGGRKVLEVMCGRGWLAKALQMHDVEVIAADNSSWSTAHTKCADLVPVECIDAEEAVRKYTDVEVLIISWPPYADKSAYRAARAWKHGRPIVFIGEGAGGCTAEDTFFRHMRTEEDEPVFPLMSWFGIHDYVGIYQYTHRILTNQE